jgi:hypothetical protein
MEKREECRKKKSEKMEKREECRKIERITRK